MLQECPKLPAGLIPLRPRILFQVTVHWANTKEACLILLTLLDKVLPLTRRQNRLQVGNVEGGSISTPPFRNEETAPPSTFLIEVKLALEGRAQKESVSNTARMWEWHVFIGRCKDVLELFLY